MTSLKSRLGRCKKCGNYYDGECRLTPCTLEVELDKVMIQASTDALNAKIRRKYANNRKAMARNPGATYINSLAAAIKHKSTRI